MPLPNAICFLTVIVAIRRVVAAKKTSLRLCASALIILCAVSAPVAHGAPLATVAERPVDADAVHAMAARNGYAIRDAETAERALRETIDFEVLAAEAEKAGYFADPDIVRTMKSMAVQKLVAAKVDRVNPPELLTEEQLSAYYKDHVDEFTRPAIAKGRVLMVRKDRDGAVGKAEEIEKALKTKGAFSELVRKYTDDPTARANGGVTPWLVEKQTSRRYPQLVIDALFALTTAQTVSPKIETDGVWYWAQLLELRSGSVTPYETAKRTIARKLAERERLEAYGAYVAGLKDAVKVTIDPQAVSNLLKNVSSGSMPPAGPVRMKMGK